jgi:hypothetical protein
VFEPEPEPHQNFYPEPEPQKIDAAPQHCFFAEKELSEQNYFTSRLTAPLFHIDSNTSLFLPFLSDIIFTWSIFWSGINGGHPIPDPPQYTVRK